MASKHLWKTALTDNDSTAQEEIGVLRKEWDTTYNCFRTYRYCHIDIGSAAVADGTPLGYMDIGNGSGATTDYANNTHIRNRPAGVGIGTITANYYGWLQVAGYHPAVKSLTGTVAKGDSIIHAAGDALVGTIAIGTAPTHKIFGVAVETLATDTTKDPAVDLCIVDIVQ